MKETSNTFFLDNPTGEILIDEDKYFLSGKKGVYEKEYPKIEN